MLSGSDEGARSVLYNSDRLYQLPLGLIGVAVGLALVPRLTRHFAENDQAGADRTMDDGIGLSMAFTLPAAIALLIMPFFIIDATVTRGVISTQDFRMAGTGAAARRERGRKGTFMCGIVGYTGPRQASRILVDGLKRLEYRGTTRRA